MYLPSLSSLPFAVLDALCCLRCPPPRLHSYSFLPTPPIAPPSLFAAGRSLAADCERVKARLDDARQASAMTSASAQSGADRVQKLEALLAAERTRTMQLQVSCSIRGVN